MNKIVAPFSLSESSNDTIFYDIVGNFIPPEWKNLTSSSGKILSKTARQILSLVVSRMPYIEDKAEEINSNGINLSNELQETYYYFEKLLGLCQRRIRQCLVELEKSGYIKVALINMTEQYTKYRNILSIKLVKNFVPYPQKISGQPENYFGVARNNFHPHNIIDNNKSINKSRYEEADFENDIFDKGNLRNENINDLDNTLISKSKNESLEPKVINQATSSGVMKKTEEFHPLTEEDEQWLRSKSGRDFNLRFMNKLLLKLADNKPNNRFSTKEKLLNYMAKALINEKRDTVTANSEDFSFEYDHKTKKIETYLKEIELSSDTRAEAQLKRKIAAVFEPNDAYKILQASILPEEIEMEEYTLKLKYNISLSEHIKRILLNQIQAVYGAKKVKHLKVIYTSAAKPIVKQTQELSVESYIETALVGLDDIWRKVREYLIYSCGKMVDIAWFSKLELTTKDQINNKIFLKPKTAFIGSRITADYFFHLKKAFENFNYSYELIKV